MPEPLHRAGQQARPLPPELAGHLQDLAQALLGLEHVLGFYPRGHQARQVPLERLLAMMQAEAALTGEGALAFAGELLSWRGALYSGLPAAARKLSVWFGSKSLSRLSWSPGLTAGELEEFISLTARGRSAGQGEIRDPAARFEHLRADGLDYQGLMAESAEGQASLSPEQRDLWQALLLRALAHPDIEPSAAELSLLREPWAEPAEMAELLVESIGPGARAGDPAAVESVRRFAVLAARAAACGEPPPEGECAGKLGAVARKLPAALRLRLLEATLGQPQAGISQKAFGSLAADEAIALIAETFSLEPGQIGRLARIFQQVIPRQLERMELTPRLWESIRRAGDPVDPLADNVWDEVQELFTGESGDFMSPGYQQQLRRLATREEARRGGETSLADLPDLEADLASARVAEESLQIQFEQFHLASGIGGYREALDGVAGLCGAALAAGDLERGLRILRQLLQVSESDEPLAGPRAELEQTLRAIASPAVLQALPPFFAGLGADDRRTLRTFFSLVPQAAAPVLLDALVDDENPAARPEAVELLQALGAAALPEMLRRLSAAPPALVRVLLPVVAELRDPAAAPALLGLLGRDDAQVRRAALRALLSIDSPEVRRVLPALLEDGDPEIVQVAAAHLGELGSPDTVRTLLRSLEPGFFLGRRAEEMKRAIFVLGRMRATAAVGPLTELLRQRTWINRRVQEQISDAAAQALARIGGDEAKKSLEQAVVRGPEGLALKCRRLLARWGAA